MKEMISSSAKIESGVEIGFNVFIGPGVTIKKNTKIMHNAVIDGRTEIGENCKIFPGASIGLDPQDLKFAGEDTEVRIGNNCTIREYVTINKATAKALPDSGGHGTGITIIGSNCLFMAYAHVGHDCRVGDNVIMANVATLAGHVTVEEHAIVGGIVPVHQFCTIGRYSMIGGDTRVNQDVPPFCKVAGNPMKLYGLNSIGLRRQGFSKETLDELSRLYRLFFRSKMNHSQALKQVASLEIRSVEGRQFIDFVQSSKRGICRE